MNCIFDCKSVKSLGAKDLHVSALDDSLAGQSAVLRGLTAGDESNQDRQGGKRKL